MDDTLSFNEDTKKTISTTEVAAGRQFGVQSDASLVASASRVSFQQNLHVLSTKKTITEEPLIPATLVQKLSYFSMYICTVGKLEILCKQQNNVNRFFWLYIANVLCKSLPMTYVYLFLSAYAPDNHLYISKMVPLCYGTNWIFAITGVFQVIVMLNASSIYFVYFVMGVYDKVPWKRCNSKTSNISGMTYHCYNLVEFAKKCNNADIIYDTYFYSTPEENFSLAQIEYFDSLIGYIESNVWVALYVITTLVIILALLTYRQLYKEFIWKVLFYSHMALCALLLGIFVHVVIAYENKPVKNIKSTDTKTSEFLMNADFDLLAESMTAPPIVHVINSRSVNQIQPSFGSGIITTANAAMYIFKALTSYLMETHCERFVNVPIIYWHYDKSSAFYIWPIYFATIYFGDFFVLIFFAVNAVVDYCVCLLTLHCIVETIRNEWKWMRPWCIIVFILIAFIIDHFSEYTMIAEICFITWTGFCTLVEAVTIFWMYPLSRFVDDITFHCGSPPTKLRVFSFRILPIFYLIKIYVMFTRFLKFEDFGVVDYTFFNNPQNTYIAQSTLFLLGIVFAIYKYVYKQKKDWTQLFKPLPEWGPKDFISRQLRKQFNSNEFIASQAPRDLSRHLINKAELRSYKVDVRYSSSSRSTWTKMNNEKIA